MKKLFLHRDFLLFALLIVLIKISVEMRESARDKVPAINCCALTREELPEASSPQKVEPNKSEPFRVHEVDQNTISQIECAFAQIEQTLAHVSPASLDAAQLRSLQQKLSQLRRAYEKTSPAVALLGPLGSAAVVLKENELNKELLKTIQRFSSIVHAIAHSEYTPLSSITESLASNHVILQNLNHA